MRKDRARAERNIKNLIKKVVGSLAGKRKLPRQPIINVRQELADGISITIDSQKNSGKHPGITYSVIIENEIPGRKSLLISKFTESEILRAFLLGLWSLGVVNNCNDISSIEIPS